MSNQSVLVKMAAHVATVTLNRPDTHNAFDEDMIAAITRVCGDLAANRDVHAVVLRGAGKSFSAGGDINWMKRAATYTQAENERDGMALATMLNALFNLPKVTIACVQGAAMGGGMGLAACCDIVLAGPGAVFALSEVKLGLIPATISPYVLRAIGERQFIRYAQSAEKISAVRAQDIGLVHEAYESDGAMQAGLENILAQMNTNGPLAMAASKALARDLVGKTIDAALVADTACRIAATRASDEAREGLSAFLEKRKAGWVR